MRHNPSHANGINYDNYIKQCTRVCQRRQHSPQHCQHHHHQHQKEQLQSIQWGIQQLEQTNDNHAHLAKCKTSVLKTEPQISCSLHECP